MTDGRANDTSATSTPALHSPGRRSRWSLLSRLQRWQALVVALTGLALWGGRVGAADETPPPARDTGVRPEGDWTPVSRELLHRFLLEREQAENAVPPAGPFIERIVYRGELQDDDLSFQGELDGVVRSDEADAVLDLQHVSLYLGDLRWEHRPVEWGSTDDGRSVLLVPENGAALAGRWSLAHREVGDRIEYRVQVPPAAASRFELSLPAGWRLESSAGTVFPPAENGTGPSTWIIELGRRHECRWTLERSDAPQSPPLLLAEEQSHVYSVSEDRCQIHAGFEIRVLRGPVRELRFVLPEGFQYSRTTYAGYTGNVSLSARREQQDGVQMLVVPLPELSPGLLKTVEIDGTIPTHLNTGWQVPTISLVGARTMQGTRRLRVEMPLAVSALRPTHLRQTTATFNESGVDWSFEELNDESALEVQVVVRKARIAARVACRIDEKFGNLQCDALVRLNTQSGTWYDTEFLVPPDWEVFDVVSATGLPDSAISYWRVSDRDAEGRLRVEFRQAGSLQSTRSILIRSRAPRSAAEDCAAPIPVPIDADDCHVLLVVDGDHAFDLVSTEPLAWTETQHGAANLVWPTELDALYVPDSNDAGLRFFESVRAFDTARLQIQEAAESDGSPAVPDAQPPPSTSQPVESPADLAPRPPTLALTLRSRLLAGAADSDRHEAVFQVVAGQCTERMSFRLVPEFSVGPVLVNGEPTDYVRQGDQIVLTGLGPDVHTIEIRYAGRGGAEGWLSQRTVWTVPPASSQQIAAFRWEVRMPRGYRVSRVPSQAYLCSGAERLTLVDRMLGPFFRAKSKSAPTEAALATFRSISPPEELTLELWNADVARACAWVVFLAALLVMLQFRQAAVRYWPLAAMALMFVSVTLAAMLPSVPALLSGSIFTGVVVAVLLPRCLSAIRRPRHSASAEQHPTPSDHRVGWTAVSQVVAAACLSLASLCTADDGPVTDPADSDSARARVFIPDHRGQPGSVVYVDNELARELAAWLAATDPVPQPLLRTARYVVSADDASLVRAEIDVLVPTGRTSVPVRLPFAGVTFRSSDACLVDGVPAPVRPATDGRGMIVQVTGDRADPAPDADDPGAMRFRSVRFSLEFRPHLNDDRTARQATLPVLIDSRLILHGITADDEVPQVFRAGTSRQLAAGREVELGPVGELYISTGAAQPSPEQPGVPGQAVSVIELQPRHARIRTRLEISRPPRTFGPDPSLPQVVELAGLCNVREVAAQNLTAFHVRYPGSGRTTVELVFDQFNAGESVVRLDYTRPPAPDGEWRFPDIIRVDGIPLAKHLVGVAASRGFLIDADRTAADADGVEVIAPETYVERVSEEAGWPAPDVAYQVTPPLVLPMELDRLETERSAGVEQTVSVNDDRTTWNAVLSMNVVGAPATQHRIGLSSAVQVESVSVVQDGAERLLSWSQSGSDLVIFLTGDRTGVQQIRLEGRCTAGEESLREVPTIRIAEATIGKLETRIENRSRQIVELLNSRGELSSVLSPVTDTSESASSRTFDAEAPDAPAHLRMRPRPAAFALEAMVAVSTTHLAVGFRPTVTTGEHDWELVFPAEYGDRFSVEPSTALLRQQPGPAGETVLTVRTTDPSEILTLAAPLSAPQGGRWTLPTPTLRNAEITQSYIAAPPELPFVPDADDHSGVEPDAVWQSWLESVFGQYTGRVVPVPLAECILKRRADDSTDKAAGMLVETLLFSSPGDPGAGRTSATVMTHQREIVTEFAVPDDVELLSAAFNDELVEAEWVDSRTARFRVVNDEPIGLAQFVLNWRSRTTPVGHLVAQSFPTLSVPPADCGFRLIIPSAARQAVVRNGITPLDRREFNFIRAKCLIRILEQVVPGHIDFDAASRTVTAGFAVQLQRHLETLDQETLDSAQAARLAALQVEWEGIRSLLGDDWEGTAGDGHQTGVPLELWNTSPGMLVVADARQVAGSSHPTTDSLEFIEINPALLRETTAMSLLSGLLAALVLLHRNLPARWVRFFLERDTMIGAAVLGLLWWLLLPLDFVGLTVCVIALIWEVVSVFRTGTELPRSI